MERNKAENLYSKLINDDNDGISIRQLLEIMERGGIRSNDPRVQKILGKEADSDETKRKLSKNEFVNLLEKSESHLFEKALAGELIIPDFEDFQNDIQAIFEETKHNLEGEMKDILPHPQPDRQPAYAVSICTVDGQLLQLGDHDLTFLIQSICKPINYAIVHRDTGKEKLHKHVGVEPGSEKFESNMVLNERDLPHNPLINSGAIMTSAFIKPEHKVRERLDYVMEVWKNMTGGKEVNFNEASFQAERKDANKHLALAHLMKDRGAFPADIDLHVLIDFYLQCCAIEVNIDDLAHAAATLANYGTCVSTGKKVFGHDTVRDTLSLMLSSGTYDHSGEFAFRVGLPAKSGIAGGMMVVVPGVMGISVYSPPLDKHGNSVRGVDFCEKFADRFNFHHFDAVDSSIHGKKDPRKNRT
ncbi:glutaminase A [Pontibacter harenae]|uniref:glutaminase A n=1 Tax=Pontibacter harenae TaxID=2894083 RepID=UPI001E3B3462|nr:glutaminase A [Pontibacter harenae]MCC9168936.1 glutaminase A [Pontibacter harenae]